MSSAALIKAEVEHRLSHRFPAEFGVKSRPALSSISTGIAVLDDLCTGIPCGALTEICANPAFSNGTTSLLMSLLKAASGDYFCAVIDCSDAFNVRWADASGVQLDHLLWVRCQERAHEKPLAGRLNQALKATDLLLKANCGFTLIVLDLQDLPEALLRRIPLDVWYRLRLAVEQLKATLVITTPVAMTGACSALVLRLHGGEAAWESTADREQPHNSVLEEFSIEIEVGHGRNYKKNAGAACLNFTSMRSSL